MGKQTIGPLGDIAGLLARLAAGTVFVYHGLPKLLDPSGTSEFFGMLGIPFPQIAAVYGGVVEVVGGLMLAFGFALPVVGALLFLQMAAAYVFAHLGQPLEEWELALVLGTSALALGFSGGRLALDRLMPWGRRSEER
ncbi:DoxX family protein [Nocardiopsis sp. CNT312]|uniref:DoxX family protein n=1 Tax=Nocardiopsis sp. CNT312 TaxID=1137268 RepID=UPI0004921FD1|nr:DoxX family protein [Nocardiopsis sp. CNT312]